MINNYFKVTLRDHNGVQSDTCNFFVDTVPESIEAAYESACLVGENPAIFRPAKVAGPWDKCPVVGHRLRGDILRDLSNETDNEELVRLHAELNALVECYADAGRQVPLTAVAA